MPGSPSTPQGRDRDAGDAHASGMSSEILGALAAHPDQMARLIEVLSPRVTDQRSLLHLMHSAAAEAVRLLPDTDWAGVTAQFDGTPFTAAHTADRVLVVDEQQYRQRGGPCLESMSTGRRVRMTLEQVRGRWPWLAVAAEAAGVRTFIAEPVLAQGVPTATLNMYGARAAPIEADADVLTVLTEYLGRGMLDYCRQHPDDTQGVRLRQAVHGRSVLDLACGCSWPGTTSTGRTPSTCCGARRADGGSRCGGTPGTSPRGRPGTPLARERRPDAGHRQRMSQAPGWAARAATWAGRSPACTSRRVTPSRTSRSAARAATHTSVRCSAHPS